MVNYRNHVVGVARFLIAVWGVAGALCPAKAEPMQLLVGTAAGVVQAYNFNTGVSEGSFVSGLGNVIGITSVGDAVYVGSFANSTVSSYGYPTAGTGSVVVTTASGMGQPAGMATGPDNAVYIASFSNSQVMKYDPGSNTTSTFVSSGLGGLLNPHGLAFGPDGGLYVGAFNGNVYRYTSGGASDPSPSNGGAVYAQVNGGGGAGPRGLTFGPDRSGDGSLDLYVTDQENKQIRVYAGPQESGALQPGAFIETYIGYSAPAPGALTDPVGVQFIGSRFYVSDFAQEKIKTYDAATGSYLFDLVSNVGANPTYFIAQVPEPSLLSLVVGALGTMAFSAARSRCRVTRRG